MFFVGLGASAEVRESDSFSPLVCVSDPLGFVRTHWSARQPRFVVRADIGNRMPFYRLPKYVRDPCR